MRACDIGTEPYCCYEKHGASSPCNSQEGRAKARPLILRWAI